MSSAAAAPGNANGSSGTTCQTASHHNQQQQQQRPGVSLLNGAETRSRSTRAPHEHEHIAVLGKVKEEEVSQGEVTYNMVAAMNEHLLSSSATNSIRSTASSIREKLREHEKDKEESGAADEGSKLGILSFSCDFDHMYASMTDGATPTTANLALGISPLRGTEARQSDVTEVKHLKELLLLHLDLIQQQSEQIVTKDKLLTALRQENETLKLRLERMDRRVSLQKLRSESTENLDLLTPCSPTNLNASLNSLPSTSEHIQLNSQSPQPGESFKIRLNTSGGITTVKQESSEQFEAKQDTMGESWENKRKRRSESSAVSHSNVKRRRGVSSSSTISNDTSSTMPETLGGKGPTQEIIKKSEKKGKSLFKKECFLTTEEHYYTAVGEPNYTLAVKDQPSSEDTTTNLEVPSWRVKVYTSCYTMEGTENLDDEIFNKRHLKLENDERRRKRWDVQRIREQRQVEKLKRRQEKQIHHSSCYNLNHSGPCLSQVEEENIKTLWPEPEQMQGIQVDDLLPVSAFGTSITSFSTSEYCSPWINTKSKTRRSKHSSGRRKRSRR